MSKGDWSEAANVLCIRLDSLGDVLMTTPAIRALKAGRTGRRVTLLTSSAGAQIGRLVPEVDDVIIYDAPWMKATGPRFNSAPDRSFIERLYARDFDAAAIFTVYSQSSLPAALTCFMADIPLRLAYCRENPYQLLTDWVKEIEPEEILRHEVQRHLDLVATVGCESPSPWLSLRAPEAAYAAVVDRLAEVALDPAGPWVVIHPGASASSRRYPAESYAVVARRLTEELGAQVIFTGSKTEQDLVAQVQAGMQVPSFSLAGRLTLPELVALIDMAPLLVTNNTGPSHIAAALGTPVVVLYALTNPQHTPWAVASRVLYHDVPCKFCYKSVCPEGHHACLRQVDPGEVVRAAGELLAEGRPGRLAAGFGQPIPGWELAGQAAQLEATG